LELVVIPVSWVFSGFISGLVFSIGLGGSALSIISDYFGSGGLAFSLDVGRGAWAIFDGRRVGNRVYVGVGRRTEVAEIVREVISWCRNSVYVVSSNWCKCRAIVSGDGRSFRVGELGLRVGKRWLL